MDWLQNPWALLGTASLVGFFGQAILPRHRWQVAAFASVVPLILLMLTTWWRIWERDALFGVGVFFAFLICGVGSILSLLVTMLAKRIMRSS